MKTLKKITTILCMVTVAMAFTLPVTAFAETTDYDPAEPLAAADENASGESGQKQEQNTGTQDSEVAADAQTKATTTKATTTKTKAKYRAVKKSSIIKYKGKNAKKIPVLTYHMLCSAKEKKMKINKNDGLTVSVTVFKKQMRWLKKHHYTTLSMEEFYLWHEGKIKVPPKSVVITFDDGKYSVIKYALPVLKKYNMKGTAFIIGRYTSKKTKKYRKPNGKYYTIGLDVMRQVNKTYPNFEFQSHTYNMHGVNHKHPKARSLSLAEQKADFAKQYEKFGFEYLAYPYGIYSKKTIKAAKANHIKMAFSYGHDGLATKRQNKYKIKRIKVSALRSMDSFYKWFETDTKKKKK